VAFATFLVWRLRTGACGVGACGFWRYRMAPPAKITDVLALFLGSPRPIVSWWLGDSEVDTHSESQTPLETVNHLKLASVGRNLLAAKLQCRAQPFPAAAPLVATVQLEIYCK